MRADGTIDYEALAQDAMRGVVRAVLEQTAQTGLPGEHHFYISFDTLAAGVVLSKRLREKYPGEMTIVLQHRFWDLIVNEDRFEVKLTFDGIPERLVIPYGAIRVFFDPSVRYGLQFENPEAEIDTDGAEPHSGHRPPEGFPGLMAVVPMAADRTSEAATEAVAALTATELGGDGAGGNQDDQASNADDAAEEAGEAGEATPSGAEIVSLDAFRKK